MISSKKFLSLWGPVVFWCLVIFGFSSIPMLPKVGFIWWDFVIKKSAHVGEYAIFYFLLFRAFNKNKFQVLDTKNWLLPLLFGLLYASSDEFHQSFVPGRTSRVRDVGFDLLGMLLSLWFIKKHFLNFSKQIKARLRS
jgi:VanZ family protein